MIELARADLPPEEVVHDDLLRLIFTCYRSDEAVSDWVRSTRAEAETQVLLAQVEAGEAVVIARDGVDAG